MTEQRKLTSADKEKERIKKVLEKVIIKKLRDAHIERDRQIDIEKMLTFYRKPPSTEVPLETSKAYKVLINNVFDIILKDDEFLKNVFDYHTFFELNKNFRDKTLSLILDCALQLFNKIIEETLKWNINKIYIYHIAIACLSIAVKNITAHDWLNYNKIIPQIIKALNKSVKPIPKPGETPHEDFNFDLKTLRKIEFDILEITGSKGCDKYDLKKDYTDYFKYKKTEYNFELDPDYLKYKETEDKFDPDETISSKLSKDIKEIIAEEEKEKEEEKKKKKRKKIINLNDYLCLCLKTCPKNHRHPNLKK